ncbi:hypothetical protein [Mesoaciditoga lauensis]|uniref:hypothetical protein n=1 Tax=Mesoaciditoga lauensis TaxID=1495039 RepID=UPI00055DA1C1|nr:hypothetical protein [Mesoaciditoga lauensis]
MDFAARIRFVMGIIGFFVVLFVVKEVLALNFDPIVYNLQIEGLKYLNPSYLKLKVMPIGGVHLSKLTIPSDPFIKSYTLNYVGNGRALLDIKERSIVCIIYANEKYFLASKDGYFLLEVPKAALYKATGYTIFFDIDSLNLNNDRIINPMIVKEIGTILSYPVWFRKKILEVDVKKKTLYFVKGVSVKVQSFALDSTVQQVISKLVENSEIGSRYFEIEKNFVHLPNL